ncbi:MAG TPA: DUF1223 domain-containing protein [Caulobacteraceae bacterium]|jgi:hypothetical protein|nr:DUF1223 domain-containing protein [Caulobacteraceae bacterium]
MKGFGVLAAAAAMLAGCQGEAAQSQATRAADAARPVVVELFQSQGCSSCPPANANLNAIADRPDVLALSFAVTYWDDLGWKDTFARDAYTARQWDYAHGLHHANVFTPQMVVNGRRDLVGVNAADVDAAVRSAGSPAGAALSVSAGQVSIAAGPAPASGADVWLVRYDPRVQQVAIKRGENGGRTLPHRNIVRELTRLGAWTGKAASFRLPAAPDPALKTAVLVQTTHGGPILGAIRG